MLMWRRGNALEPMAQRCTNALIIRIAAIVVLFWGFSPYVPAAEHLTDGKRLTNTEYGFSVVAPKNSEHCEIRTGDHPHGFALFFSGSSADCATIAVDTEVNRGTGVS
jgi:hypothetical protein